MSGASDLASAAWPADGQESHEFNGAFVTSVNADGTVGLNYLGETHPYIEALASYMDRQLGDLVIVRSNGDHWTVIGKVGDAFQVQFPEMPQPPVMPPSVTWGTTDPSPMTGWNSIIASWAHTDGRIYHKTGAGTPPPPVEQPPLPAPPPAVTTFTPVSSKSYVSGSGPYVDVSTVTIPKTITKRPQGLNDGWIPNVGSLEAGPWASAWFYGTALVDFVQANYSKISKIEVRVVRSSETHGWDEDVSGLFYVHNHATAPSQLVLVEGPWRAPPLYRGAEGWLQLQRAGIDLINAGSARGLAIWSPNSGDFFIAASGTGDVRITTT